MLKILGLVLIGILLLLAASMVYVRFAPVDQARWHKAPATATGPSNLPCADAMIVNPGTAEVHCQSAEPAQALLERLDATAMATPRTRRIAGSPAEGMITWETRSRFWAFPDYTTAQARDDGGSTRLDIAARLRFGESDFGVNAARLKDWLSRL